jgi:Fe-S cluster assembly protein SufD
MSALPTRRDEAWRWSDLGAALADAPEPALKGEGHIIARLAAGMGAVRSLQVPQSETLVAHLEPAGLSAECLDIEVAPGAVCTRLLLQTGAGVPLSLTRVRVGAGGVYRQLVLSQGGRLARLETEIALEGEGASASLVGLYLAGAGRHADLTSRIVHAAPRTRLEQVVRGAARKGGRGVFQGAVFVELGAVGVDASQNHGALLLEDGAEVFAKPELRILCDDVQCAHGNTVGALDSEALFYMRQRGLPEVDARALLVEAFLAGALPDWLDETMTEKVLGQIRGWLGGAP